MWHFSTFISLNKGFFVWEPVDVLIKACEVGFCGCEMFWPFKFIHIVNTLICSREASEVRLFLPA